MLSIGSSAYQIDEILLSGELDMRFMLLRFAVTCCLVVLAFHGLAIAQKKSVDAPAPQIKTSIAIESATLARDQSAIVTLTIQNLSGKELDLKAIGSFDLKNLSKESATRKHPVVGDRYWGPANISTSKPTELKIIDPEKQKQGIVVGQVPRVSLQFATDETKTFKVDLTKLFWNDAMSSIWPEEPLFKVVPKGTYALSFGMSLQGVHLESNEVEVSLK
jgi:hypothetical protein